MTERERIRTLTVGATAAIAIACAAGTLATYLIMALLAADKTGLMFVIGAITGTQAAALLLGRRQPQVSLGQKLAVGVVVGTTNVALGLGLHLLWHPFRHADIVIGVSGAGSFIFPLALLGTFLKSFARASRAGRG